MSERICKKWVLNKITKNYHHVYFMACFRVHHLFVYVESGAPTVASSCEYSHGNQHSREYCKPSINIIWNCIGYRQYLYFHYFFSKDHLLPFYNQFKKFRRIRDNERRLYRIFSTKTCVQKKLKHIDRITLNSTI